MRILRIEDVLSLIGLSRSWVYEKMKSGEFPKSVKLGKRAVGWREKDIFEWLNQLHG